MASEPPRPPSSFSTSQPPSTPPPKKSKNPDLTRDQRLVIRTLRDIDWTYTRIAKHMGVTERQVQRACTAKQVTPPRRSGRPPTISDAQVDAIIDFLDADPAHRLMSYDELNSRHFAHFNVSTEVIRNGLRRRGYKRSRDRDDMETPEGPAPRRKSRKISAANDADADQEKGTQASTSNERPDGETSVRSDCGIGRAGP